MTVRFRILSAVLIITAAGMVVAGGLSYALSRQAATDDIAAQLEQEASEFRRAVDVALEDGSGVTVRTDEDLLRYAIKATIPDRNEAVLGLVDGKVALVAANETPLQRSVPTDAELIAAARSVAVDDPTRIRMISTAQHRDLAYVSIPVQVAGDDAVGHYLAVIDVRAALSPVNRIFATLAGICVATLILVAVVGAAVAGQLLAPLRALQRTAQQITDSDLSERIPADQLAGRDEVADVGRTMNTMLDRLSESFDQQRRLLDEAGHELRTPITIVRGHLELVDPSDPADVTETRDLALDELDRMHRMVDEMIMLAKSRRPDFVQPRPTEVGPVLTEVLDKVRPLADRDWRLEGHADPGSVELDPQRITQALVQLVANAVRFTEPGAVIALGAALDDDAAAADDDRARVWVRDEGAGIADDEQATVFERFHRGADQNTAHPEGAGLGLSVVSAIAAAHGGRVELASGPGQGSTFTLVLPRTAQPRST